MKRSPCLPPVPAVRVILLLLVITQVLTCSRSNTTESAGTADDVESTATLLFSLEGSEADYQTGIKALLRGRIHDDVMIAIHNQDRRLIGIHGYALEVPGLEGDVPTGFTIVPIQGTSDVVYEGAQSRFQDLLYPYAKAYNSGVLSGMSPK
jgi:hypothetical protein